MKFKSLGEFERFIEDKMKMSNEELSKLSDVELVRIWLPLRSLIKNEEIFKQFPEENKKQYTEFLEKVYKIAIKKGMKGLAIQISIILTIIGLYYGYKTYKSKKSTH